MEISSERQGIFDDRLADVEGPGEMLNDAERRDRPRLPLRWPIYISSSGWSVPLRSETRNLSSRGFYFLLNHRLPEDSPIECDLEVPSNLSLDDDDALFLRCRVKIQRVDKTASGEFGFACLIEDYRLIHRASRTGAAHPAMRA